MSNWWQHHGHEEQIQSGGISRWCIAAMQESLSKGSEYLFQLWMETCVSNCRASPEAGTVNKVGYITVWSNHAPVCFRYVFNMLFYNHEWSSNRRAASFLSVCNCCFSSFLYALIAFSFSDLTCLLHTCPTGFKASKCSLFIKNKISTFGQNSGINCWMCSCKCYEGAACWIYRL